MNTLGKTFVILTALAAPLAVSAEFPTLRFSIPAGEQSDDRDQTIKSLRQMFDMVKKRTGVRVVVDPVAAYTVAEQQGRPGHVIRMEKLMSRLQSGETDIVPLTAEEYLTRPGLKELVDPYLSWTVGGRHYGKECLYVHAETGPKTVEGLRGGRVGSLTSYVTVRRLLHQEGVDEPLERFFGSFSFEGEPADLYQKVASGEMTAFHDTYQGWYYYRQIHANAASKVKPLACLDKEPLVFMALRRGADRTAADTVARYTLKAHRDPDLGTARWFFVAFEGKFFRLPDDYFTAYEKKMAGARRRGWVREALRWHTETAPRLYKEWQRTTRGSGAADGPAISTADA